MAVQIAMADVDRMDSSKRVIRVGGVQKLEQLRVRVPTAAERARAVEVLTSHGAMDLAPMLGLAPSPRGPRPKNSRIPESWEPK